jgi:mannan endo-1,4-beta-mannosidase
MRIPRPRALALAVLLAGTTLAVPGLFAAASTAIQVQGAERGFVKAVGSRFLLDGKPFRYGGTNNYYMIFASPPMVDDVLLDAKAMDLTVLRAWASLDMGSLDGSVPHVDGPGEKAGTPSDTATLLAEEARLIAHRTGTS